MVLIETGVAYGCLFCESGSEQELCNLITYKCPDIDIHPAMFVRHRTSHGVHTQETKVFIPGYVFFRCADDIFKPEAFPRDKMFKLLKNEAGDWRLIGSDFAFAQWLLKYDGLLRFSEAYLDDGWVRMLSGPLKDMENEIVKVDKRGRAGLIEVDFNGKTFRAWLGFTIVDKPEGLHEEKTEEQVAWEERREKRLARQEQNAREQGTPGGTEAFMTDETRTNIRVSMEALLEESEYSRERTAPDPGYPIDVQVPAPYSIPGLNWIPRPHH